MKRKANKLIIGIIFLAGLSLLLYPFVANQWNNYRQKQLISSYEQTVSEKDAAHEIDYDAELQKAEAYNEALLPSILPDSFAVAAASDKEDQSYMDALNIAGDEMMGIVEIPKIDIKLPIYHTTDEDVLKQAAGHLEGSSLPIGGKSTHAVISAHRGLPSASLFTDRTVTGNPVNVFKSSRAERKMYYDRNLYDTGAVYSAGYSGEIPREISERTVQNRGK